MPFQRESGPIKFVETGEPKTDKSPANGKAVYSKADQIVSSSSNVKEKIRQLCSLYKNAGAEKDKLGIGRQIAGQIRYLSEKDRSTSAWAKLDFLLELDPQVALSNPDVFSAANKAYFQQQSYTSSNYQTASAYAEDFAIYSPLGMKALGFISEDVRREPGNSVIVKSMIESGKITQKLDPKTIP